MFSCTRDGDGVKTNKVLFHGWAPLTLIVYNTKFLQSAGKSVEVLKMPCLSLNDDIFLTVFKSFPCNNSIFMKNDLEIIVNIDPAYNMANCVGFIFISQTKNQ